MQKIKATRGKAFIVLAVPDAGGASGSIVLVEGEYTGPALQPGQSITLCAVEEGTMERIRQVLRAEIARGPYSEYTGDHRTTYAEILTELDTGKPIETGEQS